jgi:predicted tellurium resistance membrane protein TerC
MSAPLLREIAFKLPILKSDEERENFLGVLGALTLRWISLGKASEIMNMNKETLLGFLDALGVEYSYLKEEDVGIERNW